MSRPKCQHTGPAEVRRNSEYEIQEGKLVGLRNRLTYSCGECGKFLKKEWGELIEWTTTL